LTIPPNGKADVTLKLALMSPSLRIKPADPIEFQIDLSPIIEGSLVGEVLVVQIHGKIKRSFTCDPEFIQMPQLLQGHGGAPQRALLKASLPIATVAVESSNTALRAKANRLADDRFELIVGLSGTLHNGPVHELVFVRGTTKAGVVLPRKPIRVVGYVREPVEAIPSCLFFKAHNIGSAQSDTLVLASLTDEPFQVDNIKAPPELVVTRASCPRKNSFAYEVTHKRAAKSTQLAPLVFTIKTTGNRKFDVKVPVTEFGVDTR
jgi:hypothetical protein